jgi:hypothetical protein
MVLNEPAHVQPSSLKSNLGIFPLLHYAVVRVVKQMGAPSRLPFAPIIRCRKIVRGVSADRSVLDKFPIFRPNPLALRSPRHGERHGIFRGRFAGRRRARSRDFVLSLTALKSPNREQKIPRTPARP